MKKKISQAEFARWSGLTKQAISKALKNGLIPFEMDGAKKKIDINNPDVKSYVKSESRQREAAKKKDVKKPSKKSTRKVSKSKKTSKKSTKKKGKAKAPSKKSAAKKTKTPRGGNKSGIKSTSDKSKSTANDIHKEIKIAELAKKQMQVEILQKKFLPTDFIQDYLFRYIEKLNNTLERSASVFINEVGQKILEAEEVTPKHIDRFVTLVLEAVDDTKKNILKEIKKYDPI